jgi:hypothetical protein
MHILLEALGGLTWLLIGFLVAVAFGSFARAGASVYGDPSPKPHPLRVLVRDPAEAPVVEAAKRVLTGSRPAVAGIAPELEAIPPVATRRVGQGGPTQTRSSHIT